MIGYGYNAARVCFFVGKEGIKCRHIPALQAAREKLRFLNSDEFTQFARVMCHGEKDTQREDDCSAFQQLKEFGAGCSFAERLR